MVRVQRERRMVAMVLGRRRRQLKMRVAMVVFELTRRRRVEFVRAARRHRVVLLVRVVRRRRGAAGERAVGGDGAI